MPEGDTVWQSAHRLHRALAGRPLIRSDLRVPKLATVDLRGHVVTNVQARGKHLLTRFDHGWTLHSHLRMEGAWLVFAAGQGWRGGPAHQIRAILANEACAAVGYRLPVLELLRTADEHRAVGHLGPDLLGEDWDPAEATRRLRRAPDRAIGEALLDQANLAGVGNVYKSELCFLTGVNPWTPVSAVPDLPRIVGQAKRLLEFNKERTVRVTTGDTRPGRNLWVYGRKRGTCQRCGTPIQHADQGPAGEERITYWCPSCQKQSGG